MALLIMEQIEPVPAPGNRFRIVEAYVSVDGMRTRMTHRSFPTLDEARDFVSKHTAAEVWAERATGTWHPGDEA